MRPSDEPQKKGALPQGRPRRILVVDDNTDSAEALADALSDFGHVTQTAFDGPTALRCAQDFQPDTVLLDIGLPIMNGFQVALELRRVRGDTLQLIAITGYGQESDRARTLTAGFDLHVTKPVEFQRLLGLIAELDQRKTERVSENRDHEGARRSMRPIIAT